MACVALPYPPVRNLQWGRAMFGSVWGRSGACIQKGKLGCPGTRGEKADREIGACIEVNAERKGHAAGWRPEGRAMFRGAWVSTRNGGMRCGPEQEKGELCRGVQSGISERLRWLEGAHHIVVTRIIYS